MKKLIIYISAFCLLAGGCVSSKKDTQKSDLQKETSKQETVKNGKTNSKDKKNNSKLTADQQRIKEEIEKNKQLEKEAKQRQKQEKKEAKKKQKEIDDLIKNATKNERKRIEEERKKEKEELLNSLKNKENKDTKDYASDIEEKEKTALTQNNNSADTVSLEDILGGDSTQNVNLAEVNEPESNSDIDKLAGKLLKKKDKNKQVQPEQIINLDSMSAMDKILFLMNDNNLNKTVSFNNTVKKVADLTDSQKKKLINQDNDTDDGVLKRKFKEAFPPHIDRNITYETFYSQQPKSIMILYPWNRSKYNKAEDLMLIAASKELASKGYYVPSALSVMETYKEDTLTGVKDIRMKDIRRIGSDYGMDAVLLITLYRFESPSWSSQTHTVAHYTLISTSTLDTLFSRQIDFKYDSPIPPKENKDKDLELDAQQRYDLGVIQQMQTYAFMDIPYGYYHKKYKKDKKKFSNKKEVKYKINVRPS